MKLITTAIAALMIFSATSYAQPKEKNNWHQKMQSEMIAFITAELDLTPEEAQVFWPVYNQIAKAKMESQKSVMTAHKALKEALNESAIQPRWRWCINNTIKEDIAFISALRENPGDRHNSFLRWLRTQAHDYRHRSTWKSAWMMVALGEYLKLENAAADTASVQLQDGQQLTLGNGITRLTPPISTHLALLPTALTTTAGTAYMNVKFRALPEQTEYPGVTEKGMQVTRVYEVRDKEGRWQAATEFSVGDVVRVTLTCAKAAEELQYFVLEDYLPASMEAINPEVPGQAAGLEWQPWSSWFDHKEYLADRVRGFCTRWGDRSLLNMSYYARVKRAGTATAPPAQAQLMYEPQYYGLSPNTKVKSK